MNIIVHIGASKSASSFLQEAVFPAVDDLHFMGKFTNEAYPRWLIDWVYLDDLVFSRNAGRIREKIITHCMEDKINVISSEAFFAVAEFRRSIDRLFEVLPEARVLYVLRDPISWLRSRYVYGVQKEGLFLTFDEALDFGRSPLIYYRRPPIYLPSLYYSEHREYLEKRAGTDGFLMLKYELLSVDPEAFFSTMEAWAGVKLPLKDLAQMARQARVNPSDRSLNLCTARAENLKRMCDRYGFRMDVPPFGVDDSQADFMTPETESRIREALKGKCNPYEY